MSLKSRLVAPPLRLVGYWTGFSSVAARRLHGIRILMFHDVGGPEYPIHALRRQMRYLTAHFTVVSLPSVIEGLTRSRPLPTDGVVLTFDDGLWNHASLAYPILREFNTPATFYVCPRLIDEGLWQWPYDAQARLSSLSDRERIGIARELGTEYSAPADVIEWMKSLSLQQRNDVHRELQQHTRSFTPTPDLTRQYASMTWQDLESLDPDLITVGCHTNTHPILRGLTGEQNHEEIVLSKEWLESKLRQPVHHFCYPNGDFDEEALAIVRDTYQSAVTTRLDIVHADNDVHLLPRLPTCGSASYLAWRLFRPGA